MGNKDLSFISARHSLLGDWFWATFSKWSIKLRFHRFHYEQQIKVDPARSILMIGNHTSWWDGFLPLWLNHQHMGKRFHAMMLEEELRKRPFLRQAGGFSIAPGRRSQLASLAYASDLLRDPQNLVLIYPQGRIHSMSSHQIQFQPGVERILNQLDQPPQIVFSVSFIDFFQYPKPSIFYYLTTWQAPTTIFDHQDMQQAYQSFFDVCLAKQAAKKT